VSHPDDESAAERRRLGLDKPPAPKRRAPRLPSTTSGGTGSSRQKELDLTNKELARYLEGLESAIQKTQDLSAVEEARIFLHKKGAGTSTDEAARVLQLARQLDQIKAINEAEAEGIRLGREASAEALAQERAREDANQSRIERLLAPTATRQLQESRSDMLFLTELFEKGAISEKQYLEAVTARLGLTNDKMEKTKSIAEELGLTFASAAEDAIVAWKGFGNLIRAVEQDALRIVTRKLVTEPFTKAVTDMFKGGGSGGGIGGALSGLFSKIFSFDGGGFTGDGPRIGGLDGKGGRLAMLHPRETVIDHSKGQQSAGRNVIVTINQLFAPGTSRATTLQAAADASRQLQLAARNL